MHGSPVDALRFGPLARRRPLYWAASLTLEAICFSFITRTAASSAWRAMSMESAGTRAASPRGDGRHAQQAGAALHLHGEVEAVQRHAQRQVARREVRDGKVGEELARGRMDHAL